MKESTPWPWGDDKESKDDGEDDNEDTEEGEMLTLRASRRGHLLARKPQQQQSIEPRSSSSRMRSSLSICSIVLEGFS